MPPELSSDIPPSSMSQVTKSASSPSVALTASVSKSGKPIDLTELKTVSGEKIKAEDTEEGKKLREEVAERKRPHSQQLKNIKYLTKAPSFEDTVDDFYPKTTFVPSDPLVPHLESVAAGPALSSSTEKTAGIRGSKLEELEPKSVPAQVAPSTCVSATHARPSPSCSRRSILEEMPIPTMSRPAGSSLSDSGKGSEVAMTIPASPTIKRREISTSQSKIPTSPGPQRAADQRDSDKQEKFRQQQRKLVTAIKSDAKIGVTSVATPVSSSQQSEKEHSVEKSKSAPKAERLSAVIDDGFSGGCALSSRPSSQSEETLGAGRKNASDQNLPETKPQADTKHKSVENKPDPAAERSKASENKTQSPSAVRSVRPVKPQSPGGAPSLAKPKAFNIPSSLSTKKPTTAAAPASSGSSRTLSSPSTLSKATSTVSSSSSSQQAVPGPTPTSKPSESVKRNVTSDPSPIVCSKPMKASSGSGSSLKKSYSEDSNSTTTSSSSGKPSPVVSAARKSSGKIGDTSSPFNKPTKRTVTGSGAGVQSKKDGSDSRGASGGSPASSPSPAKPVQPRSSGSGTPATGSPRRLHERCQDASGKQSPKTQRAATSAASAKSSPPSTSSSSGEASSTSLKLSQDRTPRFV